MAQSTAVPPLADRKERRKAKSCNPKLLVLRLGGHGARKTAEPWPNGRDEKTKICRDKSRTKREENATTGCTRRYTAITSTIDTSVVVSRALEGTLAAGGS